MNFPGAGELNRRIILRLRDDVPDDDAGLQSTFPEQAPLWAKIEPVGSVVHSASAQTDRLVTHRVTIRYRHGRRITDLHEVVETVGGIATVYRVQRVTDLHNARRFNVLEVEEL